MNGRDMFVRELARASRKANRFIRRLPKEAREDVLAAALLWCWEHREEYSLTATLDQWFVGVVRNAYRDWLKGERRNKAELVEEMRSHDDPARTVLLQDAVRELASSMDERDTAIVHMVLDGTESRAAIAGALHLSLRDVERRFQRMRSYIPEGAHEGVLLRRAVTPAATESDQLSDGKAAIDVELEMLDMPPKHGKDCPPCWRCKWFEGYLPGRRKEVRMEVVEPEVREAIARTEAEKVRIAKEVRDGNL